MRRGISETYGELIILSRSNGPFLGQALDDGDGTVELGLNRHYRRRRARLTVVDGYGVKEERLSCPRSLVVGRVWT